MLISTEVSSCFELSFTPLRPSHLIPDIPIILLCAKYPALSTGTEAQAAKPMLHSIVRAPTHTRVHTHTYTHYHWPYQSQLSGKYQNMISSGVVGDVLQNNVVNCVGNNSKKQNAPQRV